jgi:hypothetical protein
MRLTISLFLALCTFGAGVAVGAAQAVHIEKLAPKVLSGDDFGFRVEGRRGDTPIGALVVRVNDKWVEVQFAPGVKPVTK